MPYTKRAINHSTISHSTQFNNNYELINTIEKMIYNTEYYEPISETELESKKMLSNIRPFNSSNVLMWGLWKAFHRIFNELGKKTTRDDIDFYETLITDARKCMDIFTFCSNSNFY